MSNYGPPPGAPQDPSGQQPMPPPPPPGYGTPPAGYGTPPAGYGAAPGGYGAAATPPLAHWGMRLGAWLLDYLLIMVSGIVYWIGYGILIASGSTSSEYDPATGSYSYEDPNTGLVVVGVILSLVGALIMLAFAFWNWGWKQGKTGYTIGKGVLGIKVVKEADGQVLGLWLSIGRQFVHIVDSLACYIGWLWPLWDAKRQTFADKILSTIVIVEPKQK
ncbi:putative RDD family membrane protein YckC [Nocardioides albertanoniae]|uniref:Putative RDD family membrane protein YckC n=1 Tax=Nocardioides albertanoniae TaxID=1175486 RepID=A0A543ADV7_9ACTN|nr:RDD family protein [Nocardioides albertanoniae]TQL70774.1 putative RDD family membrane protein YckC [Nocardioides albertanoniae]